MSKELNKITDNVFIERRRIFFMSRNIAPKASVTITTEEQTLRNTDHAKLLFTTYHGKQCALMIQYDRLWEAAFFPQTSGKIGAVYIGKVKNIAQNLDACFVEIAKGEICFLSLKNATVPHLLNRQFDGRILEGDELLVQVIRDAQKSKRASVTAEISLSNDYFAIMLGATKVNYSLKLNDGKKEAIKKLLTENALLKNGCLVQECGQLLSAADYNKFKSDGILIDSLQLPSVGMVVRTMAGEAVSQGQDSVLLEALYDLSAHFIKLLYIAKYRSCFSCLKTASSPYEAIVRQFATEGICIPDEEKISERENICREIITDQESIYAQLAEYCEKAPEIDLKVRFYQDNMLPLSTLYSLDKKLEIALGKRIWLKSGGYLIIEPTEALTVIDVNSGKYEAGNGSASAYRKINMEAAREVAIQLRLRNLSGIIIVDFINMKAAKDNKELMDYLKAMVKSDKIQTTVVDMTPLGLVEITRRKTSKPLKEQFMGDWGV